ncbi:biotin--[acetyl-CoA-carboxylase] ligase [Parvularcula lutaonensis]|uniref:biotin--[biotin carboxyl-carrier protein] ligase n=1 Tax=Parvularcula lutaonensis TaxID=491923 RepID=A0ABV7MAX4_9PROT|nr:biotin--[acetyl-CoA-carboxylase] ligase [Parvularcula lutaonensis]GGY43047.1 biotin--[acetyl-CoA-carboxylase] ligase [Parvularcula lutaonensis]
MRHQRLVTCGSTNDEVRRAFFEGAAFPLLISAEQQTEGRGREGRPWAQLEGNFAGSFLVEATRALLSHPGAVSLLAGLAVRDALVACSADSQDLTLKWPNDVLKSEQKVAGILAEMVEDSTRRAFIIGIGVNLRKAPEATAFPAAAAFDADPPDPESFGKRLGETLLRWISLAEAQGAPHIFAAWRSHAWRLGEPLAVRTSGEPIEGIFEDIDGHGRMILRLPTGEHRIIAAGDAARR